MADIEVGQGSHEDVELNPVLGILKIEGNHQRLLSSLEAIIYVRCQFRSIHPGHLPTSVAT